ncbi:hypothetical protein BU61_2345 [Pontoporia blainvillei]|uniref:Uncharacterized protein n=1 Tax=Pontoporia blainvillei TaxID=48723 RepID=A0ABX0S362_PONBL|nr:hypothetical protein [Pontoporia blainvillei]
MLLLHSHLASHLSVHVMLRSAERQVDAAFGLEGPVTGTLGSRFRASLGHTVPSLRRWGLPFSVDGCGHLQSVGPSLAVALVVNVDGDQLRVALERRGAGGRWGLALGLHHGLSRHQALGVPPDNHIRLSVGGNKPPRAQLEVALGPCTLTAHGDVRTEANATRNWTLALVNHCPLLEALGVPGRVDGSGYIMVNSMAVDAQVLVTMDANTLQGLLVLSTTEMSEELTFTRWPEHISLDCTFQHNIPTLQTLWVEDKLGLLVSLGKYQ